MLRALLLRGSLFFFKEILFHVFDDVYNGNIAGKFIVYSSPYDCFDAALWADENPSTGPNLDFALDAFLAKGVTTFGDN